MNGGRFDRNFRRSWAECSGFRLFPAAFRFGLRWRGFQLLFLVVVRQKPF